MRKLVTTAIALLLAFEVSAQEKVAVPAAEDLIARLKVAYQLAREMNNRELVGQIEDLGKMLKTAKADDLPALDQKARAFETTVGIDPGGWSMSGLKIAHPTPELGKTIRDNTQQLAQAMAAENLVEVRKIIQTMATLLGDQAGLPDARRKGQTARKVTVSAAENASIFIHALEGEGKYMRSIRDGKPIPDQMLRLYANLIQAICEIRPQIQKYTPERLKDVDAVCKGACQILLDLQQPDGLFPFPDLRGKNIRFGEMLDNLIQQGGGTIKDGWMISADPSGGSQFDTGECGSALLMAGEVYHNSTWTKAGLKAAAWAEKQKCVPNFNYNSFSVGLLAHAYQATKERKYWDAAWRKWEVGVAPGQTENGRWIDAHNARTVYHLIILRAINDLLAAKPADLPEKDLQSLQSAADKAAQAVVEEFEKIGVTDTSHALRELTRYRDLRPSSEPKIQTAIIAAASVIHSKSVQGERAKFGASATEQAVLHQASDSK